MNDRESEIGAFLDKQAIRECIAWLARGEDRRDGPLLETCYWPDAAVDYGMYQGSFAEYLAWVVPGDEKITNTQHVIAQTLVELDENRANAETHVVSYHRVEMGEGERDTCIGGRYLDKLERRGGEWRIAHRTMLYDWYEDWGEAADLQNSIMGQPLRTPQYAGRARGDWSNGFFGKRAS
jgi:hypothetical protein